MFDSVRTEEDRRQEVQSYFGLDAVCLGRLKTIEGDLMARMPAALDEFYANVRRVPAMAALVETAGGDGRLKAAQTKHWRQLLSGALVTEEFRQASVRIGAAHEGIGLAPEWYLGGYLRITEAMADGVLARHRRAADAADEMKALLRAMFYDMAMSLSAYVELGAAAAVKTEILTLSDMLEREATNTVGEIAHKAARFQQISREVAHSSQDLQAIVTDLASAAEEVSAEVRAAADAAHQLESLSEDIGRRIDDSSAEARGAAERTGEALANVKALSEVANRISDVVTLIRGVAKQTRMLSLNATIEAARAGEVGKGFAVVADEVKRLAAQTEASIATVSVQADDIRHGTAGTEASMSAVANGIGVVDRSSWQVAEAAREQRAAASAIAGSMAGAASGAGQVAARLQDIVHRAEENNQAALALASISGLLNKDMDVMRQRIHAIVGTSTVKEEHLRMAVALEATMATDAGRTPSMVTDLSLAGALVRPRAGGGVPSLPMGTPLVVEIPAIGVLAARALMPSGDALHVQFDHLRDDQRQCVYTLLVDTRARDERMGTLCRTAAQRIERAFADALGGGLIDADDLFDERYRPVQGTDPQQHMTRYTGFCDRTLPDIQEPVVTGDATVIFCAAVDRNGYLPTHNRKYSEPQRPGDKDWNMAHCRNRRIFDDRAGLLAAHNRAPAFVQTYERDMGGGVTVFLKEVDCPILANGQHWGNLRLAYKA